MTNIDLHSSLAHFVDRTDVTHKVQVALDTSHSALIIGPRRTGRTELALSIARRGVLSGEYYAAWYLDNTWSDADKDVSLQGLSRALGMTEEEISENSDRLEAICDRLDKKDVGNKKWIMIVDNADDDVGEITVGNFNYCVSVHNINNTRFLGHILAVKSVDPDWYSIMSVHIGSFIDQEAHELASKILPKAPVVHIRTLCSLLRNHPGYISDVAYLILEEYTSIPEFIDKNEAYLSEIQQQMDLNAALSNCKAVRHILDHLFVVYPIHVNSFVLISVLHQNLADSQYSRAMSVCLGSGLVTENIVDGVSYYQLSRNLSTGSFTHFPTEQLNALRLNLLRAISLSLGNRSVKWTKIAAKDACELVGKLTDACFYYDDCENPKRLSMHLSHIGNALTRFSLSYEAIHFLATALELDEAINEGTGTYYDVYDTRRSMGRAHSQAGNYNLALHYFKLSLKSAKARIGDIDFLDTAHVTSLMADVYRLKGEYDAAVVLYNDSIAMITRLYGNESRFLPDMLHGLALTYYYQNRTQLALHALESAARIVQSQYDREYSDSSDLFTAAALNNIGYLYNILGMYNASVAHYTQSLSIKHKHLNTTDTSIAITQYNLSITKANLGDRDDAKKLVIQALGSFNLTLGEEHERTKKARVHMRHLDEL